MHRAFKSSRTPEEILALLDALPDDEQGTSAFTLGDLSKFKMLEQQHEPFNVLHARFTGDLPTAHEIGVREAAVILGSLQEVLSEVAASLLGKAPARGPLPADVLSSTELRLSPQVSPGSVIFALSPANETALVDVGETAFEKSLASLFSLLNQVERPVSAGGSPEGISEALRGFGPRAARHLVSFAAALKNNGLNIDIGLAQAGKPITGSHLSNAGARYLESLAKDATSRTTEVILTADILNLGKDGRHRLRDDERGRLTIAASDELTDALQAAFRHERVSVTANETISINSATGATTFSYEALSVIPIANA